LFVMIKSRVSIKYIFKVVGNHFRRYRPKDYFTNLNK
jgi:hypothetical protein